MDGTSVFAFPLSESSTVGAASYEYFDFSLGDVVVTMVEVVLDGNRLEVTVVGVVALDDVEGLLNVYHSFTILVHGFFTSSLIDCDSEPF